MCVSYTAKCIMSLGLICAAVIPAAAQNGLESGQKLIEQAANKRDQAVWVSKITVDGEEVHPGIPFQAGNDWLEKMSISLTNRTAKTIIYVCITLGFPETGDGRTPATPQRMLNIIVGRLSAVAAFSGRTGKPLFIDPATKPLSLLGYRTLEIRVGDYMADLKTYVEPSMPVTQIKHCEIHRTSFFFDDGMRWDAGGFALPDPDHPGRYKYVEGRYFPGRPFIPPTQ